MTDPISRVFDRCSDNNIIKLCRVLSFWEKCVEGEISKHTEAIKIEKGVLSVEVDSPVWSQELTYIRFEIVDKINALHGSKVLSDIRFKVKGD
ncbi:MAG: DUF721 domain-containing protein [Candidatus Margulisiibacteriota bacterium]|nr:DUF721 domain-containing protein [Candidatus Margulisiibacteriota bacterium]